MKKDRLPNVKKPCGSCPMTKNCLEGWLGADRMSEILNQKSFVCHKTTDGELGDRLQCAGHMLLRREHNEFYRMAKALNIDLQLSGEELVFDTEQECINHHRREED